MGYEQKTCAKERRTIIENKTKNKIVQTGMIKSPRHCGDSGHILHEVQYFQH